MKKMKIHIIGGPASGKTFTAKKLSKLLKIPYYELDKVFWDDNDTNYTLKASEKKRSSKLNEILKNDSWIIEGAYYKWVEKSFETADKIIILAPSTLLRHKRLIVRYIQRKFNINHPKKETLKSFYALLKWNHKFDRNNIIQIKEFIKKYKYKTIVSKNFNETKNLII